MDLYIKYDTNVNMYSVNTERDTVMFASKDAIDIDEWLEDNGAHKTCDITFVIPEEAGNYVIN